MAKTKKQTPAHKKQLKRVRDFIRRAEKRGYRFSDSLKESLRTLSTQKLKSFTPEKLYKQATALSDSGEIISGTERRKEERSASAQKGAITKREKKERENNEYPPGGKIIYGNVVEEFIERLQTPTPEYSVSIRGRTYRRSKALVSTSEYEKSFLLNLTFKVAREIGVEELGWRLEERATDVAGLTEYILYGSEIAIIQSASTELAEIITGRSVTLRERMDLAEQEEYNEDWELPK